MVDRIPSPIIDYLVRPIQHKVSVRVLNTVWRAYASGVLDVPLEEATDEQLIRIRGIGIFSLVEIRKALKEVQNARIQRH